MQTSKTFSIHFWLNTAKKKDDLAPIYARITVDGKRAKIQNDLMYGDKASKAILSNLSYQFFGKANDPDTAKYYERFFEVVKQKTTSINRGYSLDFDTRITTGEREISKVRADAFFRLKQGGFITYADGKDKKVQFKLENIQCGLPIDPEPISAEDIKANFEKIHQEARSIFNGDEE